MRVRTRALVAALTLGVAMVPIALALRKEPSTTAPTDLRQCVTSTQVGGQVDKECLRKLYLTAWEEGELRALQMQSDQLESSSVAYETACHIAAHDTGRARAKNTTDLKLLIRDVPEGMATRCLSGFVHGVIDELSLSKDNDAAFSSLIKECASSPISQYGDNGCSEGMGHMAWNITADSNRGVERCEAFTANYQRYTCVVSVHMAKHFPRPEFAIHPVVAPPPATEWYATCVALRQASPSLATGCGGAAAFVWLRTDPLVEYYQQAFDGTASRQDRAKAATNTIKKLRQLCADFPEQDETVGCLLQAVSLPWDLLDDPTILQQVCAEADNRLGRYCTDKP